MTCRADHPGGRNALLIVLAGATLGLASCALEVEDQPLTNLVGSVGLDISVINGKLATNSGALELLEPNRSFYVNHLRLQVARYDYPATDVLAWQKKYSDFKDLDWGELTPDEVEWETDDNKTYDELRFYQGAKWMSEKHAFKLEFLDEKGGLVPGAAGVSVHPDSYVHYRRVASVWAEGQVGKANDGKNSGSYTGITISSGGTFTGSVEDLYLVEVSKAGNIDDGDLEVTVTSVLGEGDAKTGIKVSNGNAVKLGTRGAEITFTDTLASRIKFTAGDRWIVRAYPDGGKVCTADTGCVGTCKLPPVKPGPPGPPPKGTCVGVASPTVGIQSHYAMMAEIRLQYAAAKSEVFTLTDKVKKFKLTWDDGAALKTYTFDVKYALDAKGKPTGQLKSKPPLDPKGKKYDYGLQVPITLPTPANKKFFKAGDKFTITFDLLDQNGDSLLLDGTDPKTKQKVKMLPTFMDKVAGLARGIEYYNISILNPSGHGYYDEHRLNLAESMVVGPKHLLAQDYTVDQKDKPWFKTTAQYPPPAMIFSAFSDPQKKNWKIPMTATLPVELPKDAKPGTYVVLVKMAREFLGEKLYEIGSTEFQVGTETVTNYNQGTGNCDVCHVNDKALARLRHGGKPMVEGALCAACHLRPHATVAGVVIHKSHVFSDKYLQQVNDCSLCHLLPQSNQRASKVVCGSCHGEVHEDNPQLAKTGAWESCGKTCHRAQSAGHIKLPPL